jgi:hypothetical protein
MMRFGGLVCLLISCVVTTAPAVAQIATGGSIRGHVKDEQDAVLPDTHISASSSDAPGTYTATSDEQGYYRLLDLPPGEYTITAEHDGFAKWTRTGVQVRTSVNLDIPVVMKIGSIDETVQVTVDTPMLESRTATNALNVTGNFQRALPLSAKRLWTDYLLLTPGVASLESSGVQIFYVNGTTANSHVFQVDGMDVMSTRQSSNIYLGLSADAIKDVQIKTSAIDASAPMGLGAIVDLVSPSGQDSLRGAAAFLYQPRRWNDNNTPGGGATQTLLVRQADVSLGGPIRRQRAWFFAAYTRLDNALSVARTPQQVATLSALVSGFRPFEAAEKGNYGFVKGVAQLMGGQQLTLSYGRDYRTNHSAGAIDAASFARTTFGGPMAGARLASVWRSALTTRVLISHNRKGFDVEPERADIPARLVHAGAVPSGGRLVGTGSLALLDNTTLPRTELPDSKWTISAEATYYLQRGLGSHELQFGVYAQPRNHDESINSYSADGFQLEEVVLRDPSNPALGFQPFRRQIFDTDRITTVRVDSSDMALYLQDAWRPTDRLTVNAGVRLDFVKRRDRLFNEILQDSTEVGPRFGANYRLSARSVVRGSWGRVHENLSVNQTTGGTTVAGFRDLYDVNLDGVFETTLITPARTALATDRVIDLENYHQAHADEWGVGYRLQLPGEVSADAGFTRRAYKDRPALVETNAIYDGSVFRGYRNEAFNQINRLTKNVWNWPVYTGFELRITKQTDRTQFLAGYTRKWHHFAGEWQPNDPASFIQPEAFPNNRGIGDASGFDPDSLNVFSMGFNVPWRDHTIVAAGTYMAPWNLTASARYAYQSGVWSGPVFTRVSAPDPRFGPATVQLSNGRVVSNPLATTVRFAFPTRGEGQFRLDDIHDLNLRLARDFAFGARRLHMAIDVFNVPNKAGNQSGVFGATNVMFSPLFRTGTRRQAPRSGQITVRVTF